MMIGALFLGLFCGVVARVLVPGDAFDWGGVPSALIGTVIVLIIATRMLRRRARSPAGQASQAAR